MAALAGAVAPRPATRTGRGAGRWQSDSVLADGPDVFAAAVAVDAEATTTPLIVSPRLTNPDTSRIYLVVTTSGYSCERPLSLVPGTLWTVADEEVDVDAATVIRELWTRAQARDWAGVGELVADDAVVEWPVSAERIVGRVNYVAINREYPEPWEIRVIRVFGSGGEAVSEVEVAHGTMGLFRAASFWTVRDGKIASGTEYWTSLGSDEGMPQRAAYVEPM